MVDITELSFQYQDTSRKVLRDIAFSANKGELTVVTGRSGCGKTTLMRCINGLCPAFYDGNQKGEIALNGKDIKRLRIGDISRMASSVFQNPENQFFTTDVLSDLVFSCENYAVGRDEINYRLERIVSLLSLEHLLGKKLSELSGGEKQKIAIASALMLDTDILLFDEPSANLDYQSIEQLRRIMEDLKVAGYTLLVIEHRLYYLESLCDCLFVMQDGQLRKVYKADEIRSLDNTVLHQQGLRGIHLFQNDVRDPPKEVLRPPLLELKGIQFSYPKSEGILKGIDLTVRQGDRIALLGKNGCGKTTLGKILSGLKKEGAGSIIMANQKLSAKWRSKVVSYVMQNVDFQLFGYSVSNDLLLGNEKRPHIKEEIPTILSDLGLWEFKEQHPMTLSMGQKQRLVIAGAYLLHKKLNVFDEPTSGLDYESMQSVCELIRTVTGQGCASIVITHDYEFILSACNRVVLLEGGKIVADFMLKRSEELEELFKKHL